MKFLEIVTILYTFLFGAASIYVLNKVHQISKREIEFSNSVEQLISFLFSGIKSSEDRLLELIKKIEEESFHRTADLQGTLIMIESDRKDHDSSSLKFLTDLLKDIQEKNTTASEKFITATESLNTSTTSIKHLNERRSFGEVVGQKVCVKCGSTVVRYEIETDGSIVCINCKNLSRKVR